MERRALFAATPAVFLPSRRLWPGLGNVFCFYNFLCIATGLAFVYRGNRVFCKCVCPATVFLRVRVDKAACVFRPLPDGACHRRPPKRRKNAADCILCLRCVEECPQKALKF